VIAFGKLSEKINGKPLLLPGRHWFNLGLLVAAIVLGAVFLQQVENGGNAIIPSYHDRYSPDFRCPHGHGDKRRGYAGGYLHTQQLFRLGCGGNGLHVKQRFVQSMGSDSINFAHTTILRAVTIADFKCAESIET
jgi:hypothetical protein